MKIYITLYLSVCTPAHQTNMTIYESEHQSACPSFHPLASPSSRFPVHLYALHHNVHQSIHLAAGQLTNPFAFPSARQYAHAGSPANPPIHKSARPLAIHSFLHTSDSNLLAYAHACSSIAHLSAFMPADLTHSLSPSAYPRTYTPIWLSLHQLLWMHTFTSPSVRPEDICNSLTRRHMQDHMKGLKIDGEFCHTQRVNSVQSELFCSMGILSGEFNLGILSGKIW